tara:strand:+ start:1197 stop:1346 length:150 start_codon:yes stop_codon:yes gene_type:complete
MFFDLIEMLTYIVYGAIIEAMIVATLLTCLTALGLLTLIKFFFDEDEDK